MLRHVIIHVGIFLCSFFSAERCTSHTVDSPSRAHGKKPAIVLWVFETVAENNGK